MKFDIKPVDINDKFKPFQVTLTFETKEEAVRFHDEVMGKITNTSLHDFHGKIYRALRGDDPEEWASNGTI